MIKKILFFIILTVSYSAVYSQVKVGNNPETINPSSILELESTDKVLVITRMTTAQMNAVTSPLTGALVYNTDENCVYMFTSAWQSLCTSASGIKVIKQPTPPLTNVNLGDFWINESKNDATNIWNGTSWIPLNGGVTRGNGTPNVTTTPNPIAGDIYVDSSTGVIYTYDGTTWIENGSTVTANNGVSIDASTKAVQLGGALTKPTVITTDATNTLTIEGLQQGDIKTDDLVTINPANGQLRKVKASTLLQQEDIIIRATTDGQSVFDSGFTLKTTDKVNVYRNGVRVSFNIDSTTKITLEPDATCYAGDEIRIVQFY